MTLRHLKIFLEVCRCGGMSAAAEKLGLAQPAVSLAVRELEESCGVRLFDRISHKLYLTEDGRELLKYARQIVSLCDEMEDRVRSRSGFRLASHRFQHHGRHAPHAGICENVSSQVSSGQGSCDD